MARTFEKYTSKTNLEDELAIKIEGRKVTDASAKTAELFLSP
jgi:hypothetical protein